MNCRVLIIDDEESTVRTLRAMLLRIGIDPDFSYRLADGLKKIDQKDYDIVLLDVNLPDGDGIKQISSIIDRIFPPQIIIMTGYLNPDGAQLAIESGAWDYLSKPVSQKELQLHISRAFQYQQQKKQAAGQHPIKAPYIIGESRNLKQCLEKAAQIVTSDANVLISGETGTGKELFAKAIHENSLRKKGEFVVVDCSILSENLIESVLFGHEKGAFTGADKSRRGLIALAHGGTLFMDEVGELPESIQSSFLRVLQEKRYRPVGSEKEEYSDFRVICATNKDLEKMAAEKLFRTDLLYRLKTFVLNLPPLKKRQGDIPLIARELVKKSCESHAVPEKEIAEDFFEVLEQYDWPGNVREMTNVIETSVTTAGLEKMLFAYHMPPKIRAQIARSRLGTPSDGNEETRKIDPFAVSLTHRAFIETAEKKYLETLWDHCKGDIQKLIGKTGLSRTVLYRKLGKYKIRQDF